MTNAEYMREYIRNYARAKIAWAKEFLGGKCVVCGSTDNLQFDHVDPKTKLFLIADGWKKPAAIFLAELNKCQLLCKQHHEEKTAAEHEVPHGGGKLGKMIKKDGKRTWCPCEPCTEKRRAYNRQYSGRRRKANLTEGAAESTVPAMPA